MYTTQESISYIITEVVNNACDDVLGGFSKTVGGVLEKLAHKLVWP